MNPESLLNFLLKRRPKELFVMEGAILASILLLTAFLFSSAPEKLYWILFMFMIYGAFVNHQFFIISERPVADFSYYASNTITTLLSVVIPFYLYYSWSNGLSDNVFVPLLLTWALISYFLYAYHRMRELMKSRKE